MIIKNNYREIIFCSESLMIVVQLRQPKRKRRWPWVLLVLFIIFVVLPVGALVGVYYMVSDSSTKIIKRQENFSAETFGQRVLVDAMDYAPEDHKIAIAVTENDMDNVLMDTISKASTINRFVKKAYMTIKGDEYDFYADLDFSYLQSRIKISTTLTQDDEQFIFKVKDISVGKITGLKQIGTTVLGRFINEDTINGFISQAGISIKYVANDSALYYKKSDIFNDMSNLSGGGGDDIYFNIMQTLMKEDLFSFSTGNGVFIEAGVDLEKLSTNDLVTDDADHLVIAPDEVGTVCRDKLVTLINAGALEAEDSKMNAIFSYLFHGYDQIKDDEKAVVDATNMSSIALPTQEDKEAYKGFDLTNGSAELIDKMKETINPVRLWSGPSPDNLFLCELTEKDINNYIKSKNVFGYTTLLHRETEDGYKVNFVTIDNFYCNLYNKGTGELNDKTAEFVCKLNINGYHTSLTFDCHVHDTIEGNRMVFSVDEIKFGSIEANDLKDQFFGIIADALSGATDGSLSADKETYTFAFDFNYIINQAKDQVQAAIVPTYLPVWPDVLNDAFNGENVNIDVYGEDRSVNGSIKLTLKQALKDYIPFP